MTLFFGKLESFCVVNDGPTSDLFQALSLQWKKACTHLVTPWDIIRGIQVILR